MVSKEPITKKALLGRPSNNLKIGIVGLPNVGKSTFFNNLTKSSVPAENFPFCTIDPSEARVEVPDDRFDWLVNHYKPKSRIPAYLTVYDIAGLVKGASEGKGLGNAFLSHIKAIDGIYHLVRAFDDLDITHVEGDIDPVRDLEIIDQELRLKDIEYLENALAALKKSAKRSEDKEKKLETDVAEKALDHLHAQRNIRFQEWQAKEIEVLNRHQLLSAKPVIYLVNLSKKDYARKKNRWLAKIKQWIDASSKGTETLIPFSCDLEQEIADTGSSTAKVDDTDTKSALPKIITTGYHSLNLCHYFTAGEDEVRAWTVQTGTKAPQAAGIIHTDFERGFISAEIMKFDDLKELGSEAGVRAAGKYCQKGKEYVVQDGDIIFFKFNVTAQKKK